MNEAAQRRYAEEIPDLPLTGWFEPDVLPIRSGVFEVVSATLTGRSFRYFDGSRWYTGGPSPDVAFYIFQTIGRPTDNVLPWRGVAGPV